MRIFAPILFIAILLTGCSMSGSHPSDQEMIQNFQNRQHQFEDLVVMVQNDVGLRRVDDNWTDPSDPNTIGISLSRIKEYRALFSECGTPRGFQSFNKDTEIRFIATALGLATGGSSKGYAFRTSPPAERRLVGSIDNHTPENGKSYWIYRPIASNWYLFYEYDD